MSGTNEQLGLAEPVEFLPRGGGLIANSLEEIVDFDLSPEGQALIQALFDDEPFNEAAALGSVILPHTDLATEVVVPMRRRRREPGMGAPRGRQDPNGLHITHDRKVSPTGYWQASRKRWVAKIPNSLGLPSGDTCPGKTDFCKSCYAANADNYKSVNKKLWHNYDLLRNADSPQRIKLLGELVARVDYEFDLQEIPAKERFFRHHWSGDFFDVPYAEDWAAVMEANPDDRFLAYTRSIFEPFNVIPVLAGLKNLSLYISTDVGNVDRAHQLAAQFPSVRLAYCAEDYRRARELTRGRGKALICPENIGKYALMEDDGRGVSNGRGACVRCQVCVVGKQDILFSTSHREDSRPQLSLALD